jgi:hypothetical protein
VGTCAAVQLGDLTLEVQIDRLLAVLDRVSLTVTANDEPLRRLLSLRHRQAA